MPYNFYIVSTANYITMARKNPEASLTQRYEKSPHTAQKPHTVSSFKQLGKLVADQSLADYERERLKQIEEAKKYLDDDEYFDESDDIGNRINADEMSDEELERLTRPEIIKADIIRGKETPHTSDTQINKSQNIMDLLQNGNMAELLNQLSPRELLQLAQQIEDSKQEALKNAYVRLDRFVADLGLSPAMVVAHFEKQIPFDATTHVPPTTDFVLPNRNDHFKQLTTSTPPLETKSMPQAPKAPKTPKTPKAAKTTRTPRPTRNKPRKSNFYPHVTNEQRTVIYKYITDLVVLNPTLRTALLFDYANKVYPVAITNSTIVSQMRQRAVKDKLITVAQLERAKQRTKDEDAQCTIVAPKYLPLP